jgi:LuxR family glucitol operon transcriptional activator
MALAMFAKHPVREVLAYTAGLTNDFFAVEEGLARLQGLSLVSLQEGRCSMLPLTREYALAELAIHSEFEREARERWVTWYLNFTEQYGGEDWKDWHIRYDRVEEEWENLLAVFTWCAAHEQYQAVRAFWKESRVCGFSAIYGYWDDRLFWLEWLGQAAERCGDWSAAVEARRDQGYILTLLGRLKEADVLLGRAWNLQEYADAKDVKIQVELIQDMAQLRIYQGRSRDAHCLLDQAKTFLNTARLDEQDYIRRCINDHYYRGLTYYEEQSYDQAETCFRAAVEWAQTTNWQRTIIYAQNYLANIAIVQGRPGEAESLLKIGLTESSRNKDKRFTAHYMHSFARLYKARGDIGEAHKWAIEALDGFERLGMQREVEEVKELLQTLGYP